MLEKIKNEVKCRTIGGSKESSEGLEEIQVSEKKPQIIFKINDGKLTKRESGTSRNKIRNGTFLKQIKTIEVNNLLHKDSCAVPV